jgi:Glycosyltransferase WbsX
VNNAFVFHRSSPGAFQAWLEATIEETREQHSGDEQIVFLNAWNEWAEGNHLEPDARFGHGYLEAVNRALTHGVL